jgi:heat-inducible transcriptional repressor
MDAIKSLKKKFSKTDRVYKVLFGLINYYLKTGKPVGSNTLKEAGFEDISSATIRNYFAQLEQEGLLTQQHSSGGRLPTHAAYRLYAEDCINSTEVTPQNTQLFSELRQSETREIASYLQQAAETLSTLSNCAVFLSAPRFDHDYIIGLKLMAIDHSRCLCVIITDFGIVQTELLHLDRKLSAFTVKRMEAYFHWRLTGHDQPENFDREEELLAQKIYNELMIRYIVNYSNFIDTELYRTGFSKLLAYPDFHDASALASSSGLLENAQSMRQLSKECCKVNQLKFWIGDDLMAHSSSVPDCAVIAIPYYINQNCVGVVGLLGPARMSYPEIFGIIRAFATSISEALTRNIYKYKITFRQPHAGPHELQKEEYRLIDQAPRMLLEDSVKRRSGQ